MSVLYATGNFITLATLDSVTNEDDVYLKEYLYDHRQAKPLRFTAKTGDEILINLGSSTPVTLIALMNHNLTDGATVTIDHNSINSFPNAPQSITWHVINMFKRIAITDTWFKIAIADAANPEYPEIGELILTTWDAFPRAFKNPHEEDVEYIINDAETPFGQRWRSYKSERVRFVVDFEGIHDADVPLIKEFFDDLAGIFPFVFIPDDSKDDAWYMEAPTIYKNQISVVNYNSHQLDLIEQTRGITVL